MSIIANIILPLFVSILLLVTFLKKLKVNLKEQNKLKVIINVTALSMLLMILFGIIYYTAYCKEEKQQIELIKSLNYDKVKSIEFFKSLPNWKVNLVDTKIIIDDKNKIKKILSYLKFSESFFINDKHDREWETYMQLNLINNSSITIKIYKLTNKNTLIYLMKDGYSIGEFENAQLGEFLEMLTYYNEPSK